MYLATHPDLHVFPKWQTLAHKARKWGWPWWCPHLAPLLESTRCSNPSVRNCAASAGQMLWAAKLQHPEGWLQLQLPHQRRCPAGAAHINDWWRRGYTRQAISPQGRMVAIGCFSSSSRRKLAAAVNKTTSGRSYSSCHIRPRVATGIHQSQRPPRSPSQTTQLLTHGKMLSHSFHILSPWTLFHYWRSYLTQILVIMITIVII